jgi:DNA-binding CsgD family transcriptional regulator
MITKNSDNSTVTLGLDPLSCELPVPAPCSANRSGPFGDVAQHQRAHAGFDATDLLAAATESIPAWQRDTGQKLATCQTASLQRQAILKAMSLLDRFGVILDATGGIVQGNPGWSTHLAAIPTLSVEQNVLVPLSVQSQQEFIAGLKLLFGDFNLASVPVALRDLDGWVTDVIHLKRVGTANPDRAYALLPKSQSDTSKTLVTLSTALSLTPLEVTLVRLIVKGDSNQEMATALGLKQSGIKRAITILVGKFRVRQKSDIVRIMASFP